MYDLSLNEGRFVKGPLRAVLTAPYTRHTLLEIRYHELHTTCWVQENNSFTHNRIITPIILHMCIPAIAIKVNLKYLDINFFRDFRVIYNMATFSMPLISIYIS